MTMTHQLPPEVRVLTEDDIYRTSSQFRVWSFSPESLAERRRRTHEIAIERIEDQRKKSNTNGASINGENGTSHEDKVDYLTEEEELRLVQRYCDMIRATNDHLSWPANVKVRNNNNTTEHLSRIETNTVNPQATAIQYFRRFYLSNSALTYPPKEIYKTALYLANKAESNGWAVSAFAQRISAKPEEILACEYKVIQALRFTLDVRQPNRGLKGVMMELDNIVEGQPDPQLRGEIERLEPPGKDAGTSWRPGSSVRERVQLAYSAARGMLDSPALLTDAYFLYTPSQIVFASLQLADPPLADWYLSTKIPPTSPIRAKVLATLRSCAEVLSSFKQSDVLSKDERAALEDKLDKCRDPSTVDMVKAHLAKQRGEGEGDDETKAERKRLQREASARANADPFGPSIG
jgi:cyclin H